MTQSKLSLAQLHIGKPLPFDIFNGDGKLLLRRGFVIENAGQVSSLVDRGLFREQGDGDELVGGAVRTGLSTMAADYRRPVQKVSAFGMARAIITDLDSLLQRPAALSFSGDMLALAARVQHLCQLDGDAAIATVQLLNEGRYGIRRMLHVAVIAELVLQALQETKEKRQVVLAAALTSNIAMLALQDDLGNQAGPLTPEQKLIVREHPLQGVARLQELGVSDDHWLAVVAQHHESIDGKGYPAGLNGAQILRDAQVVALADRFTALCTKRANRAPAMPSSVLKGLFAARGQGLDSDLVGMLIKVTGLFPPGSLVRLANLDLAVVVKRTMSSKHPVVKSVKTLRSAEPLDTPRKHLTSEAMYAITALVAFSELGFPVNPDKLWDESFEFNADAAPATGVAATPLPSPGLVPDSPTPTPVA